MSATDPCPNCQHPKADHSFLGCLAEDLTARGSCPCDLDFPEAKATVETARQEAAQAQANVQQATDPDWATEAIKAIHHLKDTRDYFTPDDIWERLEDQRVPAPHEPRALGPIIKAMSTGPAASIRSKGFTESRRRHGAPVRIYEARQ